MPDRSVYGRLVAASRRDALKYAAAAAGVSGLSALAATLGAPKTQAQAQSWMDDTLQQIGDVPLCQVALPGTHDSGTYGMTTRSALDPYNEGARLRVAEAAELVAQRHGISAEPLILGWSKAQDLSISDQLRAGIRYLDLRVSLVDSSYVLSHVLVSVNLDDALHQIRAFTERYPSELIIVDVNHLYGMETTESQVALINVIAGILDDRLVAAPPTLGPNNTVHEILDHDPAGKARVILLFASSAAIAASGRTDVWCSEAENFPPCPASHIISLWPDQPTATGVLEHIGSQPERDFNRFYISQGQITPSEELITDYRPGLSSHPGSLREAAELSNPEVLSMAAREWRNTGANIIILDFFELSAPELLAVCQLLNGRQPV